MNIEDLTVGELSRLTQLLTVWKAEQEKPSEVIKGDMRWVIVRSRDQGCVYGQLDSYSPVGAMVTLKNARQMWSWTASSGGTLLDCATHGVSDGKFSATAEQVIVLNACGIISCTPDACKTLDSMTWQD